MRRWAVGLALLSVLGASAPASADHGTAPRTASTWLPYWDADRALQRITDDADVFHTVSPFWYRADGCTTLTGNQGAGSPTVLERVRAHGAGVVPTVTSTMTPGPAVACLGDPAARAQHVALLVELAGPYEGLEVNYEHLALTTDAGVAQQVRAAYTAFATDLCAALHESRKTCVHTVMPRTDESFSVWRGKLVPAVYDYAAVGAVADRVRVMGYDQHAPGTPPGPVAGWPWLSAVAAYTEATVPAGKGELGIPLYGRDWGGGRVGTLSAPDAGALAQRYGAPVRWDDVERAPTFEYVAGGARHTVWFSDTRSVLERVGLARAHGLGTAFWVPGQEDAVTWDHVRAVSQAVFWDVVGGELQRAVEAVAAAGIAQGTGRGAFGPGALVTRGQTATFLARALQLPPAAEPAPYDDLADSVHAASVAAVHEAGVAGGFGDGTFRPQAAVTRGQLATFLARGLGLEPCDGAPFSDLAGDPHAWTVCAVHRAGIATGYADGSYRPGLPVTRGQTALLLARALGL